MSKRRVKFFLCFALFILQLNIKLFGITVENESGENFSGELGYLMVTSTGVTLANKFEQLTPEQSPEPRYWHAMWTDNIVEKIYLFGGRGVVVDGGSLGDTQYFSENTWNIQEGTGPSKRSNMAITDCGLLFGGVHSDTLYDDTWRFNDGNWKKIDVSTHPSARFGHTLNMTEKGMVLFGGSEGAGETWILDTQVDEWTEVTPANSPPGRERHVSWVTETGEVIIFGGRNGDDFFGDTWKYDPVSEEWENLEIEGPSEREFGTVFFDKDTQAAVLFGGGKGPSAIYLNDLWIFHDGKWHQSYPYLPGEAPEERTSAAASYYPSEKWGMFFGGYQDLKNSEEKYFGDTWKLELSTGGVYVSPVFDTGEINTRLYYERLDWSVKGASGSVKFQVASSSINQPAPDNFTGPDGSTESYYTAPGEVDSYHYNNRYFRYRFFMENDKPGVVDPVSVVSASVTYNHAPTTPTLNSHESSAEDGGVSGAATKFAWNHADDSDGDEIKYNLQVAYTQNFSDFIINETNIEEHDHSPTGIEREMEHGGPYYWRVRANDGSVYGNFSSTWSIYIDTVPPAAVTTLTAQRDDYKSGAVELEWTVPDERELTRIRWTHLYEIDSESRWGNSDEKEYTSTVPTGSTDSYVVTGLNDATTYWFSVRLEDEAGNLSDFFSSPACKTNSPPEITLTQDLDGEWGTASDKGTSTIVFSWDIYDPDPEDTHEVDIWMAEDIDRDFDIRVATGIIGSAGEYSWDSRHVRNAPSYRARFMVKDQRGLSGYIISPGTMNITNYNEPPEITLITPSGGEEWNDINYIDWDWYDPNRTDTVYFEILVSTDAGQNFTYVEEYVRPSEIPYRWGTGNVPDSDESVVKVIGIDNHGAEGKDISGEFSIKNDSLPPKPFDLISPEYGSFSYSTQVVFSWEETADADGGEITYTLCISENPDFVPHNLYEDLTGTQKELALEDETIYYWKVLAKDEKLVDTESSSWGKFAVNINPPQILSSWPEDGDMLIMTGTETVRFELNKNYDDRNPKTISVHEHISIYDEYGNYISAMYYDLSLDTHTHILKITPDAEHRKFMPSRKYTVKIGKKITDSVGHTFLGDRKIEFVRLLEDKDTAGLEITELASLEIPSGFIGESSYVRLTRRDQTEETRRADRMVATNPLVSIETLDMVELRAFDSSGERVDDFIKNPDLTMYYTEEKGLAGGKNIDERFLKIFRLNSDGTVSGSFSGGSSSGWEYVGGENDYTQNKVTVSPSRSGLYSLKAYSEPVKEVSEVIAYPNPFNPFEDELNIKFIITKNMSLELEFYTLTGDLVYRHEKEFQGDSAGTQVSFTWDGRNNEHTLVGNGMYYGRIKNKGEEKESFLIGVVK